MKKPKQIAFHTLGCKLNFSETSTISRQFGDDGYEQVDFSEKADIYVINSCSVTGNAEKRCRALIRQVIKKNPEASVAVIGCYSQINPEALKSIPGVALVLGNADKFNLFEHIKQLESSKKTTPLGRDVSVKATHAADASTALKGENANVISGGPLRKDPAGLTEEPFFPSWSRDDRTRSFFKIQDGCDYFCTYCTIPLARGHSRSDTIANTIKTARQIARTNAREIVLSGVNIGDFGKNHHESFFDLLKELVTLEGIDRIRISSVEPDLLHDEIIGLVASHPKLMPHFHIPLQSGSDEVLRAMGRRYDTSLFARRIETIRKHIPHACIAADLIVGFPSETDALFNESLDFIRQTDISYIHVFTYSERDNTRALYLGRTIPADERHRRSQQMHLLSEEKKYYFYLSNKGRKENVLWEHDAQDDYMYGFTENYVKVKTRCNPTLANTIQSVELNNPGADGVYLIE